MISSSRSSHHLRSCSPYTDHTPHTGLAYHCRLQTTLANSLREYFDGLLVREITKKAELGDIKSHTFFMYNDLDKHKVILGSKNPHIFMDRGHLSTLAYSYAYDRTHLHADLYTKTAKWVRRKKINGTLREPDLYLYLRLSPHISMRRQLTSEGRPKEAPWSNRNFLIEYSTFCENYLKDLGSLANTYFIDAMLPESKILDLSCGIIKKFNKQT